MKLKRQDKKVGDDFGKGDYSPEYGVALDRLNTYTSELKDPIHSMKAKETLLAKWAKASRSVKKSC